MGIDLQELYSDSFAEIVSVSSWQAEPYVSPMYDIVEGRRTYLPWTSDRHNEIRFNLISAIRRAKRTADLAYISVLPCDVLITAEPLVTRRPDVFVVSKGRLSDLDANIPLPLNVCPDLVIEVIDFGETSDELINRFADYATIGVQELWIVDIVSETVEVRFQNDGNDFTVAAVNHKGDTLISKSLPQLQMPLTTIFEFDE